MYDKTVRRRRAVFALLVVSSLILLTAYFGEPVGGGLHSVQRGFLQVFSPVQEGASRALKPFRDLFGWFGDTLHAKSQRDALRTQVRDLRNQRIDYVSSQRQIGQLQQLLDTDKTLGLDKMGPVTGRVIGRSPTLWYATITLDRGSNSGVAVDDPAVTGDGLVGKVTSVTSGASVVTLITDQSSGVSAIDDRHGVPGVVQPAVGDPNDLLLQYTRRGDRISVGEHIVTAGTRSTRLESLYPAGIPIGTVTNVDTGSVGLYQKVHIRPLARLRTLDYVQVLTQPDRSSQKP